MQQYFEFPADTAVLEKIGKLTAEAGRNAGFDESEVYDIQLAVDEACTNAIVHGLKEEAVHTFRLSINWKKHRVEIVIQETGEPFSLENVRVPDPEAPLEKRSIGGLGLFLVHQLMDEVTYHSDEYGLKTLRMIRVKNKP